jgi:hypothetical protein
MERAKILFGEALPPLALGVRPEVARKAADQTFTVVVDLAQSLLALIATTKLVVIDQR